MEFDSHVFWDALTSSAFLHGALITVVLALLAQVAATVIGLVLALGRVSSSRPGRTICGAYVWFFRALPLLLVLLFIWNALPQLIPSLKEDWFTPFLAGFIGLAVAEAAYMAEILRSALMAVPAGQQLAGRALGMTSRQVLWRVTIPQVIRIALPPTGNEVITLLKLTSLTSVISLQELLTVAGRQVASTFQFAEFYAAAAVYYLVIVSVFMIAQARLEQRYEWRTRAVVPKRRGLLTARTKEA
jgi:polar amino acid transport system permease protein